MKFSCPVEVEDRIKVAGMSVKEEFIPLQGEFIAQFTDLLRGVGSSQFSQSKHRIKQLRQHIDTSAITWNLESIIASSRGLHA